MYAHHVVNFGDFVCVCVNNKHLKLPCSFVRLFVELLYFSCPTAFGLRPILLAVVICFEPRIQLACVRWELEWTGIGVQGPHLSLAHTVVQLGDKSNHTLSVGFDDVPVNEGDKCCRRPDGRNASPRCYVRRQRLRPATYVLLVAAFNVERNVTYLLFRLHQLSPAMEGMAVFPREAPCNGRHLFEVDDCVFTNTTHNCQIYEIHRQPIKERQHPKVLHWDYHKFHTTGVALSSLGHATKIPHETKTRRECLPPLIARLLSRNCTSA